MSTKHEHIDAAASVSGEQAAPIYQAASIPATEVRHIQAKNIDQKFRISVALPYSYPDDPQKHYPVIYLVDPQLYFGMVTEQTRIMARLPRFPETIVVGIGYPLDAPLEEIWKKGSALRARDLTPISDSGAEKRLEEYLKAGPVPTGGAKQFLQFIQDALVPLIESEYRADSTNRVLAGHSYGGLFVLYALFHQPELFSRYVAGSPSLGFGDKVTFRYESEFAKTHKALAAKLYLSVGGLEESAEDSSVSDLLQFAALVESRKYEGFSLSRQIFEDCDHAAATGPAFCSGLMSLFR